MSEANKQQKLKILYIIARFHPFRGGAEQNFLSLASRMAAKGHDVSVFTTDFKFRDVKPEAYEEYKGIKIYRFKSFIQRPYYWLIIPQLFWKLYKFDADVVHVSGIGFPWIDFAVLFKKLVHKKTKFINTPHGPFMVGKPDTGIYKYLRRFYVAILSRVINKTYDKIIAVVPKQSEWMTKDYGIPEEKIAVVPNGIEASYLVNSITEFDKKEKVIISYLNRIEWYKGVQTVISAINKLNRQEKYREARKDLNFKPLPAYEFWIMGRPGPYVEVLRKMISKDELGDKVKFVFSPSDMDRDAIFYKKSQINILPSKWEATGITLIEAMAKGNVIITTNQNQAVDILIKEGESGYSFDFGDYDKLADILRLLLEDYKLRQSIREHNFKFASEFTWDAVFPKYEEVVESLVAVN